MTENNQNLPAINTTILPAAQEFQMFQTIARSAKLSGLYGGDENKIFVVLLAARELGIPPMLALNGGIWNIQGKIEISVRLMNSMIRRAGHHLSIKGDAQSCTVVGKRIDTGEVHEETFTIEMAIKAGLVRKNRDGSDGMYMKYAEDMLYNRALSRLARRLFPDVIGTAYVEGETKEAKQQDLPVCQYEDVTPPQDPGETISESPKIGASQAAIIQKMEEKLDEEHKKTIYEWLFSEWKIQKVEDILIENFTLACSAFDRAVKHMNTKKVAHA